MPGDRNGHPFTGLTSLLRHPNHLITRSYGVDIPFCSSFGRLALYYSVFNVRNLGYINSFANYINCLHANITSRFFR